MPAYFRSLCIDLFVSVCGSIVAVGPGSPHQGAVVHKGSRLVELQVVGHDISLSAAEGHFMFCQQGLKPI